MDEKTEEPRPLQVRYIGRADRRILTRTDLSGQPGGDWQQLVWTPGSSIDYSYWLELTDDNGDRAREVLKAHQHEFQLVGDGADDYWNDEDAEEEFVIEAPADAEE